MYNPANSSFFLYKSIVQGGVTFRGHDFLMCRFCSNKYSVQLTFQNNLTHLSMAALYMGHRQTE